MSGSAYDDIFLKAGEIILIAEITIQRSGKTERESSESDNAVVIQCTFVRVPGRQVQLKKEREEFQTVSNRENG